MNSVKLNDCVVLIVSNGQPLQTSTAYFSLLIKSGAKQLSRYRYDDYDCDDLNI